MNEHRYKSTDPDWYKINHLGQGIYVFEETGYVQSYLVNGREKSILIDTGTGLQNIRAKVEPLAKKRLEVVNTHWHFDHIGGIALFERVGIAACEAANIEHGIANRQLRAMLGPGFETEDFVLPRGFSLDNYAIEGSRAGFFIEDGDRFDLGDRLLEAVATPGHTAGHMSFLDHKSRSLFCGDFAYQDTFFVHFEESDINVFIRSLEKMKARSHEFDRLLPAHGPLPLPCAFLEEVLAAFRKIEKGAEPDSLDTTWGMTCHRHCFGTFEVLVKPPGSRGIKLK